VCEGVLFVLSPLVYAMDIQMNDCHFIICKLVTRALYHM